MPEAPGATDVALTLVEAMAQRGTPPCNEQRAWHVTGPDSWLLADAWFLEPVTGIIEPQLNGLQLGVEAGFGSMAGLRRMVVVAFVLRCPAALRPLHLACIEQAISLVFHTCFAISVANALASDLLEFCS